MKHKKLLILSLLAMMPLAVNSCTNEGDKSSEAISSAESSEVVKEAKVTIKFTEDTADETLTLKEGDIIDLSEFSYKVSNADATSWSDGSKTYGPTDKVAAKDGMILKGTFVTYNGAFYKSSDGTFYRLNGLSDKTVTTYEVPASYHGLPIKEVTKSAFAKATALKTLVIPNTVEIIGGGILNGLSVEEITLPFLGETVSDTDAIIGRLFGLDYIHQGYSMPETFKKVTLTNQKTISEHAFANTEWIEEVALQGCETIETGSFNDAKALKNIIMGEGLKTVESDSFVNIPNLTDVTFPDSLETYNNGFENTGVTSMHFGKSLKEYVCTNTNTKLQEITINADNPNFTSEDGILFNKNKTTLLTYPCAKIGDTYKLPDSVTEVGKCAFKNSKLKSIDLNKVTKLGSESFRYSSLNEVTFPETLTYIGQTSFSASQVSTVHFADSIVGAETLTLEDFMFSSCTKLSELTIPAYVKDIPGYFVTNEAFKKITFLGSIKSIGGLAFASSGIKELETTFEDGATIGERIFANCSYLTTWKVHFVDGVTNYPTLTYEGGFGSNCPSIVCDTQEIVDALKEKWSDYSSSIGLEKTSPFVIEDNVLVSFNGGEEDTDVVVPEGVTRIAANCFKGKPYIEHLTLPSTLEIFGQNICAGCTSLKDVTLQNDDPSTLKFVYVGLDKPDGEERPLNRGFGGLYTNTSIIIVKNAEAKAKLDTKLSTGYMSNKIFASETIKVSENDVRSADEKTLIRYYGTEEDVKIADGIEKIGLSCFGYNSTIKTIDFNQVTSIGNSAFENSSLTTLTIPETIEEIGEDSFSGCSDLESVTIEAAIRLENGAFSDLSNCESFDMGSKITEIGEDVFSNSFENVNDGDGLETLIIPASVTNIAEAAFEDAYIQTIACQFTEEYASDTFDDGTNFIDYVYGDVTFLEE